MLRLLIVASTCLIASVCAFDHRGEHPNSSQAKPEMSRETHQEKLNIENTLGVVVLNKFVKGDFVRLYNRDGSLWYEFSYFYDDSDGKFDYANDDFKPFAFHVDHFLLVLKFTNKNGSLLEVIANEETGVTKYIKADDPVFKLETWDAHVMSVFAVNFDEKANPLLDTPDGQMKKVTVPGDTYFRPVETNGEWLKVHWKLENRKSKSGRPESDGWIRWKRDGVLLIGFVHFS